MIDKVLLEGRSQKSVSLDYCLPSGGMLPNQIAQYKKMGIQFLRKEEEVKRSISLSYSNPLALSF